MPHRRYVIKRSGEKQEVHFDKITSRIRKLAYGLNSEFCDPTLVAQKVVQGVYPGVTTEQLDELAAETAAYLSTQHADYSLLAARISVSNLHKSTLKSFYSTMEILHKNIHPKTGKPAPLLSDECWEVIKKHAARLESAIVHDRDFTYDYFGFKTLERSYLLRVGEGKIAERPQHMLMRVAVGIHMDDIDSAIETYELMSKKVFTHATPTLFNAGTPRPQMSSCFLLTMRADSIGGIYETLTQCAKISKYAGGIGLSVHDIRAKGSYVAGTNGTSNGLVPMLRVFDATARYVDQGGGKRKGSFAIYLEPWHADIEDFLELKKNHGKEEQRARDLFYALWVNDLFMKRVEANAEWCLFCPHEAPGLSEAVGNAFEELYTKYENTPGLARKRMRAQELWMQILSSQIETGTPYMLFKDACNLKSNQKNLGTIKSSNLCTEIIQYSSPEEVAVCNLASINLRAFVNHEKKAFDFKELIRVTKVVTRNLNRVIDRNYYPIPEAKRSNMRHRPVGLGVQGLADTFLELRFPYESPEARRLNRDIFETIYFAAVTASMELAEAEGHYETFPGSPISQGIFQFDMWNQKPNPELGYDWEGLREKVKRVGVRNSLLVAPMPTASTSQILGNNESTEPFTSNMYSRRVLAGDFIVVNQHLVRDLVKLGMWDNATRNQLIADRGSVQNLRGLPDELKELYKTVWEIKQRSILDMAADRGAFIDQSQSLNIHLAEPTVGKLTSTHFHAWRIGLKTGMYYLRSRPKADAIQFTVDQEQLKARNAVPIPPAGSPMREPKLAASRQTSPARVSAGATFPPPSRQIRDENTSSSSEEEDAGSASENSPRSTPVFGASQTSNNTQNADEEGCLMCGS